MISKLLLLAMGLIVILEIITVESSLPPSNCKRCVNQCPCRKLPLSKVCDKHYYLGVHFKLNWFEAKQYCRRHGMFLATLQTKEESDHLTKHLLDKDICNGRFWTSGSDLGEEGKYYWMSTGEMFTFSNWAKGQPNNDRRREHCIELVGSDNIPYAWNDLRCNTKLHFICEI